jgi:hypothetical protein
MRKGKDEKTGVITGGIFLTKCRKNNQSDYKSLKGGWRMPFIYQGKYLVNYSMAFIHYIQHINRN